MSIAQQNHPSSQSFMVKSLSEEATWEPEVQMCEQYPCFNDEQNFMDKIFIKGEDFTSYPKVHWNFCTMIDLIRFDRVGSILAFCCGWIFLFTKTIAKYASTQVCGVVACQK